MTDTTTESTDEPALEDVDEPAVDDDQEESEEKPEIDDDAEIEIDLEAIDEDLEADADDDQEASDDVDETDEQETPMDQIGGQTYGDYYVTGLVTVSNTMIESYGADEAQRIDESLARDLGLDDAVDEWIRSHGGLEDVPPGQAILIGTSMFLLTALATNPEVVGAVMEEIDR